MFVSLTDCYRTFDQLRWCSASIFFRKFFQFFIDEKSKSEIQRKEDK